MPRPSMLTLAFSIALAGLANAQQTNRQAETESYDVASPEVPGISGADINVVNTTQFGAGGVQWSAAEMGLAPGMNIDAFSDGTDILPPLPPVQCRTAFVEYTVNRSATGLPGGLIALEAGASGDGAASDTFGLQIDGGGGKSYYLASDGLLVTTRTPTGPIETDLDALAWGERKTWPVFFSLDGPSAVAFGVGTADVLTSTGNGTSTVYRTATSLGLSPFDDIDGLAVDAAGVIALSVTLGSPTNTSGTFAGYAGAGVLKNAGSLVGYVSPAELTLKPTDELDGVRITDPGSPGAIDSSQIDLFTDYPWDTVLIDGTAGNVDHVVEVGVGHVFSFEIKPMVPTHGWILLYSIGRPCVCNELPIGPAGTLAFGNFGLGCPGQPFQILFGGQGPVQFPAQVNIPLEVTLQGVVGQAFIENTTNAITLRVW